MADEPSDRELGFVAFLSGLAEKRERAALAALRRGLGKRPGEAAEMFPYVIPFCGHLKDREQDNYFLVAALFALHQGASGPSDARRNNLGSSFQALAEKTSSASIERRFVALLNATREDLDEHLRHAASLLKAHEVSVNWAQLLHDLTGWSWESRDVQRRWAQGYWQTRATTSDADSDADEPIATDATTVAE
jgi:CRISPR system Cascade subunit CasB